MFGGAAELIILIVWSGIVAMEHCMCMQFVLYEFSENMPITELNLSICFAFLSSYFYMFSGKLQIACTQDMPPAVPSCTFHHQPMCDAPDSSYQGLLKAVVI